MLAIKPTNSFIQDLKRIAKRGKSIEKLEIIVDCLQKETPLPTNHRDHKLIGKWAQHRECHIEPDWLLIFRIDKENLVLERTGSHSDLFD